MQSGTNQVFKIHQTSEGANYGTVLSTPTWVNVGVVTGGDVNGRAEDKKIIGIGSLPPVAKYAGPVDYSIKVDLACPKAAEINRAITRTNGALGSYNFVVGDGSAAYLGTGLKWDGLTMEGGTEDYLKVALDGIFANFGAGAGTTVSSAASVSAAADMPHIWQPSGMVLKWATTTAGLSGATADVDIQSFNIQLKNNLKPRKGTSRTLSSLTEGIQEITGTIQTLNSSWPNLETNAIVDATNTGIALQIVYTDVFSALTTKPTLTILCTGGIFTEKKMPLKPNEFIDYSLGFSFSAITVTEA